MRSFCLFVCSLQLEVERQHMSAEAERAACSLQGAGYSLEEDMKPGTARGPAKGDCRLLCADVGHPVIRVSAVFAWLKEVVILHSRAAAPPGPECAPACAGTSGGSGWVRVHEQLFSGVLWLPIVAQWVARYDRLEPRT